MCSKVVLGLMPGPGFRSQGQLNDTTAERKLLQAPDAEPERSGRQN